MVRYTAASLPGISDDDSTTVSPGSIRTHLWSRPAISVRAENGSPWEPVDSTTVAAGSSPLSSSTGISRPGGARR